MKRLLLLAALFTYGLGFAQQGDGGIPAGAKLDNQYKNVDTRIFAQPDIAALRAEDEINDPLGNAPWRFGYNNETDLTLENSGTWTSLPNGDMIWRLKVVCQEALTVNLTFDNVSLPEGNELYVYNEDKTFILGKFIAYHLYEGELGTELVPGNTAIVEYYVPNGNANAFRSLRLHRVTHGYRTANEFINKAFGSSGSCNMNVNCPEGAAWADQKRGVVMLVSGSSGFCTGSMINNTQNDGKPYVLTANHCYSSPASWIFRFNWESATCSNPGSSPSFESLSGAVLRARRTPSDFCLVEITGGLVGGTVPPSYNTYFSGWNNEDVAPTNTVCIHHPSGDIKKIAIDNAAATAVQAMGSTEAQSSWEVEWDLNTTTEGGSSGSPLFDQNKRIIGQLWGGAASCSNLSGNDYYGRLHNSWLPAGSNSTNQLKFWLDPNNTNVLAIDGYDPNAASLPDNAGISVVIAPVGSLCDGTITPEVTLKNFGTNTLTQVTINYDIDGGTNNVYNWAGTLAPLATTDVTLPSITTTSGAHTFNVATENPNGTADTQTSNDNASSNFSATIGGETIRVQIVTDCWGSETTWEIKDGPTVLYSGGPFSDINGGETIEEDVCLAAGCYDFIIYDSYGDGVNGSTYSTCSVDGSYSITQVNTSTVLASIINVDFGNDETQQFCFTSSAGITENDAAIFEVYPNPSNGEFKINLLNTSNSGVTVTDLSGREIFSQTLNSGQHVLDLSGNSNGTYLLKVSTDGHSATKRIVVQN